jgi:hypothetical protein
LWRAVKESSRFIFLLLSIAVCVWTAFSNRNEVEKNSGAADSEDWLFLRDGIAPTLPEEEIEIVVTGDIMPGRDAPIAGDPFRFISREIAAADLAFGNLEGAIIPEKLKDFCLDRKEIPPEFRLLLPPNSAALLQKAGFDLLGLANNHIYDCAAEGMQETRQSLLLSGLQPVGAGALQGLAYQPAFYYHDGLRIAFLAFNTIGQPGAALVDKKIGGRWQPQTWQEAEALQAVRLANEQADF